MEKDTITNRKLTPEAWEPDDQSDPLDPLRVPFTRWFARTVCLDQKLFANRLLRVGDLHKRFTYWLLTHDWEPPDTNEFTELLLEAGCAVRVFAGVEFATNIVFRSDQPSRPAPVKRHGRNTRRIR